MRVSALALGLICLWGTPSIAETRSSPASARGSMVSIPAGEYVPFIAPGKASPGKKEQGESKRPVWVEAFQIDKYPVTNGEYLAFVKEHPRWRRSKVKPIFADRNYLRHWESELTLGAHAPAGSPVVNVSWFAASAYCRAQGKELPTTDQWELAAHDRGRNAEALRKRLLEWHATPNPKVLPAVGSVGENRYGVSDLLGLVWEWTQDFNSFLVTDESRGDSSDESGLFCGGGSMAAKDTSDYPKYLRYGFRSSLKASFTVPNLGFRCARSGSK